LDSRFESQFDTDDVFPLQGIKPASLNKVSDPQIKEFIEKCLVPASERLSAEELLKDPFLQIESQKDPLPSPIKTPRATDTPRSGSMDMDADYKHFSGSIYAESSQGSPHCPIFEVQRTNKNNEFRLKGTKNDDNSVSLTLRIADTCGKYVAFPELVYNTLLCALLLN
jgi:WNK lysine deficient protein kinase